MAKIADKLKFLKKILSYTGFLFVAEVHLWSIRLRRMDPRPTGVIRAGRWGHKVG